jgi:hypothetical protein
MGCDGVERCLLLQVVNVVGLDYVVADAESEGKSPFTHEPWFDMDVTVPASLPGG